MRQTDKGYKEWLEEVKKNWLNEDDLLLPENADILEELKDPKYIKLTHSSRATYAKGCHGPLCTKAERDRANERFERRQRAKGKTVKPRLTEIHERDVFLNKVIAWHRTIRMNNQQNRYRNLLIAQATRASDLHALREAERAVFHKQTDAALSESGLDE